MVDEVQTKVPGSDSVVLTTDQFKSLMDRMDALSAQVKASAPAVQPVALGAATEDPRPLFVQLQEQVGLSRNWPDLIGNLEGRARAVLAAAGSDAWKTMECEFIGALHAIARAISAHASDDHNPHAVA